MRSSRAGSNTNSCEFNSTGFIVKLPYGNSFQTSEFACYWLCICAIYTVRSEHSPSYCKQRIKCTTVPMMINANPRRVLRMNWSGAVTCCMYILAHQYNGYFPCDVSNFLFNFRRSSSVILGRRIDTIQESIAIQIREYQITPRDSMNKSRLEHEGYTRSI